MGKRCGEESSGFIGSSQLAVVLGSQPHSLDLAHTYSPSHCSGLARSHCTGERAPNLGEAGTRTVERGKLSTQMVEWAEMPTEATATQAGQGEGSGKGQ